MQTVTVTNVAVATTKFLFGMCDCTVDSDIGQAIFRSCWGFYMCVAMGTCDRTCLKVWTG